MQPDTLEFWIDMNLPAVFAEWIKTEYKLTAKTFSELGFQTMPDYEVFKKAALDPSIVVITTKGYDFVEMTNLPGTVPKVLYLNIGNVTNKAFWQIFDNHFSQAIQLLSKSNKQLIEITN